MGHIAHTFTHTYTHKPKFTLNKNMHLYFKYLHKHTEKADIIFDFYIGDNPEQFELYSNLNSNVFINAPKISLAELAYYQEGISCNLYGFNGLPTFLNSFLR